MSDNTIPRRSPWGEVHYGQVHADGIVSVSTTGHGGIRISAARLASMPRALRLGRRRWFEEDCEASLVVWAFADELGLSEEQARNAELAVREWFPDKWEAHTGKTVEPGQSYVRDRDDFAATNADQFVADGAAGPWHADVPEGYVGCWATRAADGEKAKFLVPVERYERRGQFGYIVDPAIDREWLTAE